MLSPQTNPDVKKQGPEHHPADLLAEQADVNQATSDDGTTPLLIACQEGHGSIVEALLGRGADVGGIDTSPPPSGAPWACSLLHG